MKTEPLIVLLTDFSEASTQAFAPVVELAERLNGRIKLVYVVQDLLAIPYGAPFAPPVSMPNPGIDAEVKNAKKSMEEAVSKLGASVPVEGQVLVSDRVDKGVHERAEADEADLIALASHGRTGLRRVMMGSVAESVLRQSVTPVLVFPSTSH